MQKFHSASKHVLTKVLALAIMLLMLASTFMFSVAAQGGASQTSKSDGQVVAENYDLTAAEKELLESGYLTGATQDYQVPDESSGLISVDIDTKTITADPFPGTCGTEWSPVSATIYVGNSPIETKYFAGGNSVNYDTDSSAFSVKVKYEGKNSIDADIQRELLDASSILKEGVAKLDELFDPNGDILDALDIFSSFSMFVPQDSLNENLAEETIFELFLGVGYKVTVEFMGTPVGVTINFADGSEMEYAGYLQGQFDANNGKLNLQVLADEYNAATSKVEFLINNAAAIKEEAANVSDWMTVLGANGGTLNNLANNAPSDLKSSLVDYCEAINYLASALENYESVDAWKNPSDYPVKAGLNFVEYAELDTLVAALGDDIKGASLAVVNPLIVATTEIQFNMAMYNVNVRVELNVIDDNNLVNYGAETIVLTFAQNATDAEILAEIENSGIEAQAIAAWGSALVAGQYDKSVTTLPANLTSDIEYTITYAPKTYVVDSYDGVASYPYGYEISLPEHNNSNLAWDYWIDNGVDNVYYAQGSSVVVTESIKIVRYEGKAYESYPIVDKLVIENFYTGSNYSKKAVDILLSGALNSSWVGMNVNVRLPEFNTLVTLVGSVLTVESCDSGYNGLRWEPYSYTINGATTLFNGDNEVDIAEAGTVRVEYRLAFTNISGIQSILDLPGILAGEANLQLAALNALNNYYDDMADIGAKRMAIYTLAGAVKAQGDPNDDGVFENDPTGNLEALYNALNGFYKDCFSGNSLTLYNLMTGYRGEDPNYGYKGLEYYYKHYNAFDKSIDDLYYYLCEIGKYPTEFQAAVDAQMPDYSAEAASAIVMIDDLKVKIESLMGNLTAPNAAINLGSAGLGKLTSALESAGTIPSITESTMYIFEGCNKVAEGKVSVDVKIDGIPTDINMTFDKEHVLTEDDIKAIVEAIEKNLDYDARYYECDFDSRKSEFNAYIGEKATVFNGPKFEYNYTLKAYNVTIEGVGTKEIDLENLKIDLPASNSDAYRYEYEIFGQRYTGSYEFTKAQFDYIIDNGYTVKIVVIDLVKDFVDDLNKAVGSDLIVFALIQNGNDYSLVMKVDASNPKALVGAFMRMMSELIAYPYVAFDNNAMIYTEDDKMYVSIQALVDTVLDSGFSSNQLIGMMDANGNVRNMNMPAGNKISDKAMSKAGAYLANTDLRIGNSATEIKFEMDMYITLGAVSSEIVSVRNLFADRLAGYFAFQTVNGEIALDVTLPQKAYEAYLAALLATETIDFEDVNSISEQIAFGFMQDIINPLMEDENVSIKTVQNTLAKFGYNIDLSGYEDAFELVRRFYLESELKNSIHDANLAISVDPVLNRLDLGVIGNMVAEKGGNIYVPMSVSLTNIDPNKNYEAIYLDINASELMNKAGFVEDLSKKLDSVSGTAVYILLSDINDSLTFNTTTILNLNGFTVNGNIVGNAAVTIIDNTMEGNYTGKVNGTVSGKVTVAGGKYSSNVSAYLPSGYEQDANGIVTNKYINIIKDGNGNITVELDASLFTADITFDPQTLIIDIIAEILLNEFSTNKFYIDGNLLYEFTVEDLVSIYTAADRRAALIDAISAFGSIESFNKILNTIIDDMIDFDGLYKSLQYNLPVLSYEITTGVWEIKFEHKADGDYIDVDILSKDEKNGVLNVVLTGSSADKQQVKDMVEILADTTVADLDVVLSNKSGLSHWAITVDGKFVMDLSDNADYAAVIAIIVADSLGAPANDDLVVAVKTYFNSGKTTKLEAAINKLTIANIVKAVKQYNKNSSIEAMLENLGLLEYSNGYIVDLAAKLHNTIAGLSRALNKVDVTGPSTALNKYLNATTNAYTVQKSNVIKSLTVSGITCDLEISNFFASLQLFDVSDTPIEPPVDKIDYTDLKCLIAAIEEAIRTGELVEYNYTLSSWANLEAKLADAKNLADNESATSQQQVKDAYDALLTAYNKLQRNSSAPIGPVLSYIELRLRIAELDAKGLVEGDYTPDSWATYQDALNDAKDLVATKKANTQGEINNKLAALNKAYDDLVRKKVLDYSKLQAKYDEVAGLNNDNVYTATSWATFESARNAAKALLDNKNATSQDDINKALKALEDAYNKLVKLDYSKLQAKYDEVAGLNNDNVYTATSWATFKSARNAAKALLDSKNATSQDEIDKACKAVEDAYNKLVKLDYSKLQATYNAVAGLNNDNVYTAASWATFESARDAAKALLDKKNATSQDEIDKACKAVEDAYAALVDISELNDLIEKAEKDFNEKNYTSESWAELQSVLEEARKAAKNGDQSIVNASKVSMTNAINNLVEKNYAWIWILVAVVVLGAAGAGAYFYNEYRKKQLADSTPLVDLNAGEENAEAAEAVAENAEAAEAVSENAEAAEAVAENAEAAEAATENAEATEEVAESTDGENKAEE